MQGFCLKAYGRILWREAVEQYTFGIGIFALLVVMQASLTTMETFNLIQPTVAFGFGMALFMTAIYAAASSALLFTAEVDSGTFVFQRTKPISWLTYLSGKLSWTVLSSLVLGLAAWLETSLWQGALPNPRETSLVFGVCGVGIVEGMAWGLIATIAIRGPLRAVIAAIAMGSFATWVCVVVHLWAVGNDKVLVTTAYYQAAWIRLIVAVVVLAVGALLARVWYRTGQPLGRVLLPPLLRGQTDSVALPGQWSSYGRPCRGRSIRLLWQAWRQVRAPAVVYWGCCIAALACAGLYYRGHSESLNDRALNELALGCTAWLSLAILAFSSLLSGYTFGADQKARFLQLARDGISPWEIWLSRMAVMAAVLLPPAMVVLGLLRQQMGQIFELSYCKPLAVLLVVLGYSSALAIGQACSMFVRSRIIALLATPTMVGCFAFWIGLAVFWAGLGWKLGAAPTLLALLIGTRLLAGTRLRQDNSWRAMRGPVLLVLVAVVFSYQALAYHRAYEIQPYDSIYRTDAVPVAFRPEWQRLADAKILGERERSELVSPHKWIEDALVTPGDDAFSQGPYLFSLPWQQNTHALFGLSDPHQVMTYSEMLVTEVVLDRTLREVTAHSDIPNERLRACVDFLEDWPEKRSRRADWMAAAWHRDLLWLQHGPVDKQYRDYGFHCEPLLAQYRWFSFERKRMIKLLDRAYRIAAEWAEEYEKAVINDQVGALRYGSFVVTNRDIIPYKPARPIWYQLPRDNWRTEYGFHLYDLVVVKLVGNWGDPFYNAEAERRGTILYLALQMYYNDHARLPESLRTLVDGEYLDRLPVVPICRAPFYYAPSGAKEELLATTQWAKVPKNRRSGSVPWYAPADVAHNYSAPFLWYPFDSGGRTDPHSSLGWLIGLDFVKQHDAQ